MLAPGLLALLLASACGSGTEKDVKQVVKEIDRLNAKLGEYRAARGAFPTGTTEQIHAQLDVQGGLVLDPWGTAYRISPSKDGSLEVRSAGSDRHFDTADDVTLP